MDVLPLIIGNNLSIFFPIHTDIASYISLSSSIRLSEAFYSLSSKSPPVSGYQAKPRKELHRQDGADSPMNVSYSEAPYIYASSM